MRHEPIGSCSRVQQARSKRCPVCGHAKPLAAFPTTPAGISYCPDCRRAASRLASRRRRAAVRLLIAAHPDEWAGLLGLVRGRRQPGTNRPRGGGRDA